MLTRMLYNKNSHVMLVGMQYGMTTLAVSYKLNIHLAYDPAITL